MREPFNLTIPDGLTFRFPAGAQIMIQTHWINATAATVPQGQAMIATSTGFPRAETPSCPKP